MADDRLSKWTRWIDDIAEDLFDLWYDEIRWRQLHEVAEDNPEIPNADDFVGWVDGLYLQAVAMRVRRQSEVRKGSISLGRLLAEVADDPNTMRMAPWYPAVVGPSVPVADVGPAQLAVAATADTTRLRDVAASVVRVANKTVAHRSRTADRTGLVLDVSAVDDATTLLRSILHRYTFALKGTLFLSGPLPEYGWLQALTVPWTTPERIVEYFERDYAEHN